MKKSILVLILVLICGLILNSCATAPRAKKSAEKLFEQLEKEERKEKQPPEEEQKELELELKKTQEKEIISKLAKEEKKTIFPYSKEVVPFEEEGEGSASKYERSIEAEKRAEEDALVKALKKTGVDIYYGFSDIIAQYGKTDYQFVARYLYTWSSGIAVWERVDKADYTTTEDGGTRCRLWIKGKICSKGDIDPGYEIRLDLEGKKLGLNQTVYFPKDEVNVNFRLTRDSYVHLLCVDEKQRVYLLYPNQYTKSNFVKAGEVFEFPWENQLKLIAVLPEGQSETLEFLHIIVTKNKPLFLSEETRETPQAGYKLFSLGELCNVTKRLAELNRDQWTMLVLPYTIKSK